MRNGSSEDLSPHPLLFFIYIILFLLSAFIPPPPSISCYPAPTSIPSPSWSHLYPYPFSTFVPDNISTHARAATVIGPLYPPLTVSLPFPCEDATSLSGLLEVLVGHWKFCSWEHANYPLVVTGNTVRWSISGMHNYLHVEFFIFIVIATYLVGLQCVISFEAGEGTHCNLTLIALSGWSVVRTGGSWLVRTDLAIIRIGFTLAVPPTNRTQLMVVLAKASVLGNCKWSSNAFYRSWVADNQAVN